MPEPRARCVRPACRRRRPVALWTRRVEAAHGGLGQQRHHGRDLRAARRARPGDRAVPDRASRAGRLERLPPRDHGDRARRRRAGRPRRGRHLRGRGPRRLPGGAAAGRGVDARRVLTAPGRPGPVPRQAAPAGVLPRLPALGLRERRPRPRPAAGAAEPGRGARAAVRPRALRRSARASTSSPGSPSTRGSSSSSTRRRSGTRASCATSPRRGACAPSTSSRSTRARRWTTRRTPCSTGS